MRIHNGQTQITIVGPDGLPMDRIGMFDFGCWRGRGNPFRREIQRERRAARMARKKRRGWA